MIREEDATGREHRDPGIVSLPEEPVDEPRANRAMFVLDGFDLYFGRAHILKGITLEIPSNQVTAIIGPSGCGKSSLLRSLNRMNDRVPGMRVEGKVLFEGDDVYGQSVDPVTLRRRVGMVFQRPTPFPMSIFDNVAYGPRLHGLAKRSELDRVVESSLRDAGLWDVVKDTLRKPATALSGGEQQRLCIARTLAVDPEVILLDEPTSALDPSATTRIEELLQRLAERYTIVIVTHNMQQAARVSEDTAFLLSGELVEFGPTDKIFRAPDDRRTEDYVTGRFG